MKHFLAMLLVCGSAWAGITTPIMYTESTGVVTTPVNPYNFPSGTTINGASPGTDTLDSVTGRGATTLNSVFLTGATPLTLGLDAATNTAGIMKFWSAGANNYYATLGTGTMTGNAGFILPLSLPGSTYILNMTTGGQIGFDTNTYLTAGAIGTTVQAYAANLTTWAGIGPSANMQTLMGSADYAAARTNLGLGGAALLAVGTTTGTVAAGDDSRITGAIQKPGSAAQGDVLYYNGSDWVRLGYSTAGYFLKTNGVSANPEWAEAPGAVGGEANTGSNVGSLGVGVFKQKSSIDLQFYKVLGSTGISWTLDGTDKVDVKLDIASLTEDTTPDTANDFVVTLDATDSSYKKVKPDNFGFKKVRTGVYRTLPISAGALVPATTNGAVKGTFEAGTNKETADYLEFSASVEQYADFDVVMPEEWDLGTVKVKFVWTDGATGGTGNAIWGAKAVAVSDGDALDAAYGTAVEVTDAFSTDGTNRTTAATAAMTIAGTPAAGDVVRFRFYRKAADGSDTYDKVSWLLHVDVQYKEADTEPAAW